MADVLPDDVATWIGSWSRGPAATSHAVLVRGPAAFLVVRSLVVARHGRNGAGMRDLDWDGVPNVRDLGGLPTSWSPTGVTTVGRVARGPRRELMSERAWVAARRWGLRSVVDLRCAREVGRREEDPPLHAGATDGVVVRSAPTEDHEDAEFRAVCFPVLDSPVYWRESWRILPGLVRAALEAVAASRPGVLVHCSAGRDRTGMISALLLANAGVPPSAVVDDYARSVRAMVGLGPLGAGGDARDVEAWLEQAGPVVAQAAEDVTSVLDGLGVGTPTRRRLRALLTSP